MYALGSLLITIIGIIQTIITFYSYIIIAAAIVSWVNPDPYNPIVRFLRQATEPVFRQVRRLLPRAMFRWRIDFTPLIVLLLLALINNWGLSMLALYIRSWMGPPP